MDFGPKFTLVREGTLLADIAARAKDARPVLKQWGAYLKAGAKQAFIDKAPPLAPSTLAKQASTGTSAVTQQAKIRASYARSLDTALRRKGSTEAREDLRRLLSGDLSKGGGNRAVDRLRRRLLTAKKAKTAGMRLATGKTQLEKSKGVRGGKMGGKVLLNILNTPWVNFLKLFLYNPTILILERSGHSQLWCRRRVSWIVELVIK
jgi:hypothetical protein